MKLLFVEDDARTGYAYEEALRLRWPEVQITRSFTAEAALQAMAVESFDLILTDLKLPGLDGFSVLIAARWIAPDVPVIVMTAYGDQRVEAQVRRLSGYAVLHKPVEPEYFWSVIGRALAWREQRQDAPAPSVTLRLKPVAHRIGPANDPR